MIMLVLNLSKKNWGMSLKGPHLRFDKKNNSWLLGQFQIENKTVLGWVPVNSVRHDKLAKAVKKTHDFTWENLFLAGVKIDPDYDFEAHIDDYLKTFRADVWKRYHDDEFQLAKKRAEALRIFKRRVEEFDIKLEFVIPRATVTIEKYDFKRSAFPIEEATDTHYWYKTRNRHGNFPGTISVYFKNPELLKYLSMPADKAEQFLNSRKSSGGNVNRRVLASIRVRIWHKKGFDGDDLVSEIMGVQFFSGDKKEILLYETPDAPPETPELEPLEIKNKSSVKNTEPLKVN